MGQLQCYIANEYGYKLDPFLLQLSSTVMPKMKTNTKKEFWEDRPALKLPPGVWKHSLPKELSKAQYRLSLDIVREEKIREKNF